MHHRHQPDPVEQYGRQPVAKDAGDLICIDTALTHPVPVPVVPVAGHRTIEHLTNEELDHYHAVEFTLKRPHSLGHRKIASYARADFQLRLDRSLEWHREGLQGGAA